MNKNFIKIGVPVLALAAIVTLISVTQKSIDEVESDLKIQPFDFKSYVSNYISDSITGQTNVVALRNYNHLYDIISAEATITAKKENETSELLKDSDADECYAQSFSAYFSIFSVDANRLFAGSTWNENDMKNIKSTAKQLQTRQGSVSESESLSNFIAYVDGYYAAVGLIGRSHYCSSANSYQNYCSQAKQYDRAPYKNNLRLKNIQSEVSQNAATAWRNSISQEVNELCERSCYYYSSFDAFDNEYTSVYNKIEECNRILNSSWGGTLKNNLLKQRTEMSNCNWER